MPLKISCRLNFSWQVKIIKVESPGHGQRGPNCSFIRAECVIKFQTTDIPLLLAGCGQDQEQALRRGCSLRRGEGPASLQSSLEGAGSSATQLEAWRGRVAWSCQHDGARWCRYLYWGTRERCGFGCWGNESRAGHCEPVKPQRVLALRQPESGSPEDRHCPCDSSRGLSWRAMLLQGQSLSENRSFHFPPNLHSPTPSL